ncbi:plastocyanin [Dissophora ornata]|nr:plastocyanin [Dissophora ornata]
MRFYAVAILIAVLAPVFATVHMISITDFLFTPDKLDIAVGDTVTWTNNGGVIHTAVADDRTSFSSDTLSPLESFSHTFTTAGNVPYFCTIHPFMQGSVNVT